VRGLTAREIGEKCYSDLTEDDVLSFFRYSSSLVKNEEFMQFSRLLYFLQMSVYFPRR